MYNRRRAAVGGHFGHPQGTMAYRILTIDDHPETLDIVVSTLRAGGYEVFGTQSPLSALAMAEKLNPDLVLVDVSMPEMDGKEVCRRLRAHEKLADVPIIMFTANAEAYQKLAGFEAGADDYLTKPTEPGEMLARIEAMLSSVGKPPIETSATAVPQPETAPTTFSQEGADTDMNDEMAELEAFFDTLVDDQRTVALPVHGKLIVLIGARGGVGTTTAAINTAVAIAETTPPVLLVDLDMLQGHIALYLNQAMPAGGLHALAQIPTQAYADHLPRMLIPYGSQLRLLLSRPNLDEQRPMLTAVQCTSLISQLTQPERHVIMDLGCGLRPAYRPILERAAHVIVCLRPERIALSAAKMLLQQLTPLLPPHTRRSALVITFKDTATLPQEAIENFLGSPVLATISLDPKETARSANKGLPLIQVAPDSEVAHTFRQMAHKLITT